jgi:hypothetical protein
LEARDRITYLEALLNTPELEAFDKGVLLECAHQVERWEERTTRRVRPRTGLFG